MTPVSLYHSSGFPCRVYSWNERWFKCEKASTVDLCCNYCRREVFLRNKWQIVISCGREGSLAGGRFWCLKSHKMSNTLFEQIRYFGNAPNLNPLIWSMIPAFFTSHAHMGSLSIVCSVVLTSEHPDAPKTSHSENKTVASLPKKLISQKWGLHFLCRAFF